MRAVRSSARAGQPSRETARVTCIPPPPCDGARAMWPPLRRPTFGVVASVLALGAATALLSAAAAVADVPAHSTSQTTVAGAAVPPLLDARWSDARRHEAHLDVTGRNVVGAKSTVTASVRFLLRRGSHTAWCMNRVYSYRPIAVATAGTISFQGTVVHGDGRRERSKLLVARYSGDRASAGKVSGLTVYSQLAVRPLRAGDAVVFHVRVALDSPIDDLRESIDLTAC